MNLFKRNVLVLLLFIVVILCMSAGFIVGQQNQQTHIKSGTLIAYYENDYQRYAIDALTEAGKIESYPCLYELWTRESNWRPAALNKSSGASGIAQLKPTTWKLVGFKQSEDGYVQVDAGLAYIDRHYGGNICRALSMSLVRGWY